MSTDRRNWLKQIGLVTAGLGVMPFTGIAAPGAGIGLPGTSALIRLNANENPYGPSPLARQAMRSSLVNSNRYAWSTAEDLIAALAKKHEVTQDNILIGPGSTEILDLVVQYFAFQKGSFVVAHPSYSNWTKAAEKRGLRKISVPLTAHKAYDLKALLAAITADTKLVYICNPNNPTGTFCENEALVSFIKEASQKTMVVVDEAYIDFTQEPSIVKLIDSNKNLIVIKTFSKIYGLAGARVGYALADKETLDAIAGLQTWANGGVSVVSRAAALASLEDMEFVQQCRTKNEAAKKYTIDQLALLNIHCVPSSTNFIYFSLANYKKDFFAALKNNDILGTFIYEEEGKWTRITVGTLAQMQQFIKAIQ